MVAITFSNRQRQVKLDSRWLRAFAGVALNECLRHPVGGDDAVLHTLENVDVVAVSDAKIADVHVRFMNIEGATDVITFEHGEILISAGTARAQATQFQKSLHHEFALYIVHGLLHLNGYDDQTPKEARQMAILQERILAACLKSKYCEVTDPLL